MVKASGSPKSICRGSSVRMESTPLSAKRGNCSSKHTISARCDTREMTIIFSSNGLLLGHFPKLLERRASESVQQVPGDKNGWRCGGGGLTGARRCLLSPAKLLQKVCEGRKDGR